MQIQTYSFTQDEFEDICDYVKREIMSALVNEEVLEEDFAQAWARTHTTIVRKKGFFRDLWDRWTKAKTTKDGIRVLIVKLSSPDHENKDK
jgi:hypothetical protein